MSEIDNCELLWIIHICGQQRNECVLCEQNNIMNTHVLLLLCEFNIHRKTVITRKILLYRGIWYILLLYIEHLCFSKHSL